MRLSSSKTAFLLVIAPFSLVFAVPTEAQPLRRAAVKLLMSNGDGWAEANYRQAYATYGTGGYNVQNLTY
jgi:hypothetical protein